jgi:opacity protein-like surface antigen
MDPDGVGDCQYGHRGFGCRADIAQVGDRSAWWRRPARQPVRRNGGAAGTRRAFHDPEHLWSSRSAGARRLAIAADIVLVLGDGALLFDQAATAVAANPAAMTAPFPGRIVALDPVLLGSLGEIDRGGAIGARVTRALTARFGVEVGIDYGLARVRVAPATRDSIEATRTSFIPAFTGVIASNPSRAVRSITSNASLDEGSARELFASGALIVNLKTTGRMTPYATIGAALVATDGDLPRATLTGNYQFANVTTGASYNETDRVAVSDTRDTRSLAGILGGGMKYDVSARWGVRFDVRVFLGSNPADTRLDADPDVVLGPLPAGRVTLNAEPTIQFGNSADPVTALGVTGLAPSSLSGPAITGFRTWSGHGVSTHTSVTGGVFWRF